MSTSHNPFDAHAEKYDQWFDSPRGESIFHQELRCLREAVPAVSGRWLEVGVGSGRFAKALGIGQGVDIAPAMLRLAAQRGIETREAAAEALPFPDATFDGVLTVCALCFMQDPLQALHECCRVLKPGGRLIVAFIPAHSPWGVHHAQRGKKGHAFYASARFYTPEDVRAMARDAGAVYEAEHGCILPPPESLPAPEAMPPVQAESFMVLCFRKGHV